MEDGWRDVLSAAVKPEQAEDASRARRETTWWWNRDDARTAALRRVEAAVASRVPQRFTR